MPNNSLIENLQHPACYPHPVRNFTVLESHTAWVILTGQYVYKIKKPVHFDFLDFSTLEKRHFFCQQEILLNQALAADLYLEAVPITGSNQQPCIHGKGKPFEWAVKMKQFKADHVLSNYIQSHTLTADFITTLATKIAQFHLTTPVAKHDTAFGMFDQTLQPMQDNFSTLKHLPLDDLKTWTQQQAESLKPFLLDRKKKGFIRACHGDLQFSNIALVDDQPLIFDCIEFNENLRQIDVFSEIAFLSMDFKKQGLTTQSFSFLNAYLEQTRDYTGLTLLTWYEVYRALIRAKVAYLSNNPTALQLYVKLARQLSLNPLNAPMLIILYGFSGSGKTTLAKKLVGALGAIHLQTDRERKRLTLRMNHADRYAHKMIQKTYLALFDQAEIILKSSYPVILDATFLDPQTRKQAHTLAKKENVPFAIIHCQADQSILMQRVHNRSLQKKDLSEADQTVLLTQLKNATALSNTEQPNTIPVKTDEPIDLQDLIEKLRSIPKAF